MDSMFDLVRDRTADLRRVADDVRRERVLRTPAPSVPTRTAAGASPSPAPSIPSVASVAVATKVAVAADPCEAPCASTGARQAA
jgi:hypothetical protein